MLLEDFKKVSGKNGLLFRVAEAALSDPDGLVREVVFPVVGEDTLSKVVKEAKSTGAAYQEQVQLKMRSSYVSYYRPVISAVLGSLEFRSNNAAHRLVIRALGLLKAYAGSTKRYYEDEDDVPVEGVVPAGWQELVFKADGKGPARNGFDRNGSARIDRVVYELCVLGALRDGLRSKEIWVVGADRYRNPDEDLPQDFDEHRERYYEALGQPMKADRFVEGLQQEMGVTPPLFATVVTSDAASWCVCRPPRVIPRCRRRAYQSSWRSLAVSSSVQLPWIVIFASSALIRTDSPSVSSTSAAPRFSSIRSSLHDSGMGTAKSFSWRTGANSWSP